jgi:hypothetical protein
LTGANREKGELCFWFLVLAEGGLDLLGDGFVGADGEDGDAEGAEVGSELGEAIVEDFLESFFEGSAAGDGEAGLAVGGLHAGGGAEVEAEGVVDEGGEDVVVGGEAGGEAVSIGVVAIVIGGEDDEVIVVGEAGGAVEGVIEGDGGWIWGGQGVVEPGDFAADAEDVFPAAVRADFDDFVVAEDDGADAVAGVEDAPGAEGGEFGGGGGLGGAGAAEEHGGALVDDEEEGTFAFFGVDADVGFLEAGGGAPVHGADVVAGAVIAEFFEGEAAAAEAGGVAAAEEALDGLAGEEGEVSGVELEADEGVEVGVRG